MLDETEEFIDLIGKTIFEYGMNYAYDSSRVADYLRQTADSVIELGAQLELDDND